MEVEYKNQVNRLISLNQEFATLSESGKEILSILQKLESEADTLNTALRQSNSSRWGNRNQSVLQQNNERQRQGKVDSSINKIIPLNDSDDGQSFNLETEANFREEDESDNDNSFNLQTEDGDADAAALKRLEDALFCDDLDTNSDESSAS